jgi:basic membrane protein A and related proteins
MRFFLIALLAVALVGSVSGLKAGFIYGLFPNDLSWTYSHDLARNFLEFARPNVKTEYVVTAWECNNATFAAMRAYAAGDTDLIVMTSTVYTDCTIQVANEYPNKHFLCIGCEPAPNLPPNFAIGFARIYEARYVQGILAGQITKTGKIGWLGSIPVLQVRRYASF